MNNSTFAFLNKTVYSACIKRRRIPQLTAFRKYFRNVIMSDVVNMVDYLFGKPHYAIASNQRNMQPINEENIAKILAPQLKKHFFVVLMKAETTSEKMEPFLEEHLLYMLEIQNQGKIFASGPFVQEGVKVGDGLCRMGVKSPSQNSCLLLQGVAISHSIS